MLELTKVECGSRVTVATYKLAHRTPGPGGTTLEQHLELVVNCDGHTTCKLVIDGCDDTSPEATLERLAAWCARMAMALDERQKVRFNLPIN